MAAYLLIKAEDAWDSNNLMVFGTGYPVYVASTDQLHGKQVPPKFCQLCITDAEPDEVKVYLSTWERQVNYEFTTHDYVNDLHGLRIFTKSEFVSLSGQNSLTSEQVETFLNNWGCNVSSVSANSVEFYASILAAVQSRGFWGVDPASIVFTEEAYDSATGIHSIEVDFSGSLISNAAVAGKIIAAGGTITKNVPNRVTFDISRSIVFTAFKEDVKGRIDGIYAIRKFAIPATYVQMAIDNGGSLNVTRQQIANNIHNRLND